MRGWVVALSIACIAACGARKRAAPPTSTVVLAPPPPPPPGSVVVYQNISQGRYVPIAYEIGWERDLVRATLVEHFDLILEQARETCPADAVPSLETDAFGCKGTREPLRAPCESEPLAARIPVSETFAIELEARCAGDAAAFAIPADADPRASLAAAATKCFREKNKFKPEPTWQSIYALTELRIREHLVAQSTPYPLLHGKHLGAGQDAAFCRDDAAYLDGSPGAPILPPPSAPDALEGWRALDPPPTATPLTGDAWTTEEDRWNACNKAPSGDVVVQARCQLLRQLDRFLRDVEDTARGETPKGSATSSPAPSTSGSAP